MSYIRIISIVFIIFAVSLTAGFSSCNFSSNPEPEIVWDTLQVTVSAYNSVHWQTDSINPSLAAWGDTLKPGTKAIAVSRDLIQKGFKHNTPVKIEGFDSIYLVKDKMHYRWTNKIDIYMGNDVEKARNFGRKNLKVYVAVDTVFPSE